MVSSVLLFNLLCELFFVSLRWWAVFYFSTYCANCFCFIKVVSSVLLFYLLFQWLLFNEGCEQCFTFQLIVSIVFVKVVCSVLLFQRIVRIVLFNEGGEQCFTFQLIVRIVFVSLRWWAVFYFSTYCFNGFYLMKVVSSVLLFNLLFLLYLWRWCAVFYFSTYCANCFCLINVCEQCFTFQLIVSIVFV